MKRITKRNLEEYDNGFFNWTMSYRIDADIYFPYFDMKFVYDQLRKGKEAIDDIIRKKTGLAVGFCIYWSCTNSSKNVILLWV